MPKRFDLSAFRDGLLTPADLASIGASRGVLRRNELTSPFHGVHALSSPGADALPRACLALHRVLGADHAFSHVTAAQLWGMPLPPWAELARPVHVTAIGPRGRVRRPGVVGWETEDARVAVRTTFGVPVVAPADVLSQLAGMSARRGLPLLSVPWLVAVADFLLTGAPHDLPPSPPRARRTDLVDAAKRRRGKRGAKNLTSALELCRQGPESPPESLLRIALVQAGLPEPLIQFPVETSAGRRHADLGYPRARLLLEYQGDVHRTSRNRWLEDLTRVQLFEEAGYRTMLIGAADMFPTCDALVSRVARRLRESA